MTTIYPVKLASTASLNDCQMRNMYRYRYIIVIDFDEVIVPRLHSNLSEMVRYSKQKFSRATVHALSFRNTYFFKEFNSDSKQSANLLRTVRYQHRVPPSPNGVSIVFSTNVLCFSC
jgi:Glycosyltransferase family 92